MNSHALQPAVGPLLLSRIGLERNLGRPVTKLCVARRFSLTIRADATFHGKDRRMARPRTSPQPDVPGLAARRIAADIVDGVLRRRISLDEQLSGRARIPGCQGSPIATAR